MKIYSQRNGGKQEDKRMTGVGFGMTERNVRVRNGAEQLEYSQRIHKRGNFHERGLEGKELTENKWNWS